jgi:hypothetical protein
MAKQSWLTVVSPTPQRIVPKREPSLDEGLVVPPVPVNSPEPGLSPTLDISNALIDVEDSRVEKGKDPSAEDDRLDCNGDRFHDCPTLFPRPKLHNLLPRNPLLQRHRRSARKSAPKKSAQKSGSRRFQNVPTRLGPFTPHFPHPNAMFYPPAENHQNMPLLNSPFSPAVQYPTMVVPPPPNRDVQFRHMSPAPFGPPPQQFVPPEGMMTPGQNSMHRMHNVLQPNAFQPNGFQPNGVRPNGFHPNIFSCRTPDIWTSLSKCLKQLQPTTDVLFQATFAVRMRGGACSKEGDANYSKEASLDEDDRFLYGDEADELEEESEMVSTKKRNRASSGPVSDIFCLSKHNQGANYEQKRLHEHPEAKDKRRAQKMRKRNTKIASNAIKEERSEKMKMRNFP